MQVGVGASSATKVEFPLCGGLLKGNLNAGGGDGNKLSCSGYFDGAPKP